jgi:hypothetical protein
MAQPPFAKPHSSAGHSGATRTFAAMSFRIAAREVARSAQSTPELDIATNLTAYCQFRARREWVFYQLGGGRYYTRSTRDRGLSGIVEDEARERRRSSPRPERRGTEMAHEFAIERWDAAAVFLTFAWCCRKCSTSASPKTRLPLSQPPDREPLQLASVAFSSKPFPFRGHAR